MGCAPSIQTSSLALNEPNSHTSTAFNGALVVVCKTPVKLDRDVRVTLKLRATMVTLTGYKNKYTDEPEKIEQAHIMWEVGGVIRKRGVVLEAGENRLDFDFPLEAKLQETGKYVNPDELVKKFGKCTFIKYDYVVRVGSLQVQEFVRYPTVIPPGENGLKVVDKHHEGLSGGLAGSIVGGVTGLAL